MALFRYKTRAKSVVSEIGTTSLHLVVNYFSTSSWGLFEALAYKKRMFMAKLKSLGLCHL